MSTRSAKISWDPREPPPPMNPLASYVAAVLPDPEGRTESIACAPQGSLRDIGIARRNTIHREFPTMAIKESDQNVLPAVSVSVEVRIIGDIAEVTARQVFWNDADLPIQQGSYTFSLPNGCTVTGFTCRIGNNKVLRATARVKDEAQEAFQRAVASHATAALLDQHTPEIFTSSLGNIPPNTRIRTEITYAVILKRRFGEGTNTTTLIIPTYIANRYGDRPTSLEGLDLETKPDGISFRIEILQANRIQSVKSISHEITVERDKKPGRALKWDHVAQGSSDTEYETVYVTMKECNSCLETDFILSIDTTYGKTSGTSEAWLEMHPVFENQAAMMVALPPRVLLSQNDISADGEILFVADRSGSMGDKMANLKSATKFFLKGIPIGRAFNIWSFGSNYQPLWTKSQVYGKESLQLALDYVDTKFWADMGGTELLSVLESIVASRDPSLPCDVVILTDGEVWRLDETLGLVRRANESSKGGIRFFTLGLGDHVSHALIEGIAKQGGGYSEVIPKANKQGWEEHAVAILQAALTSHARDIKLDLGGLRAMTSPENLKYLNPFKQSHIFLLLEQIHVPETEVITLTLISDGRDIPVDISITRLGKPGTLIHNLLARVILDDVEQALRLHIPYQYGDRSEMELSRFAESLACKYSLLSQWTSLFLMQEKTELSGGGTPPQSFSAITISRGGDSFLQDRGLNSSKPGPLAPVRPVLSTPYSPWNNMPLACTGEGTGSPISRTFKPAKNSSRTLVPTALQSGTGADFISAILDCQAFDGSIENGVMDELPEEARDIIQSLKTWLREKTNVSGVALDLASNTALIAAILERDYQVDKPRWIRIHEKALEYIGLQIAQPDLKDGLMEYAREMLSHLDGPVSLKRKASTSLVSPGGPVRETHQIAKGESPARSNRVLIDKAPID